MPEYELHYFPESGNSYKLALMLALCGRTFAPVWTDFAAGVTRTPEWRRAVNAMGEIPVLVEDGVKRTQTAPILMRLAERHGRYGGDPGERDEVLRWLIWDNQKLSGTMAPYRFRRAFTEGPDPAVQRYLKRLVDDGLGILETRLTASPFVVGAAPTIADVSMVGYLSFPANESGYDLAASHPAIHAWLGRIAALPGWAPPYDLLPGKRMRCYT